MIKQIQNPSSISKALQKLNERRPLIHCITNPISINDCANALLAIGASPIMAEHPCECADITIKSSALLCNLGNITDARMESMLISAREAKRHMIPVTLDAVGCAVSGLRHDFANKLINDAAPDIIKGNMSEIAALCGEKADAHGIDVGENDEKRCISRAGLAFAMKYAVMHECVLLISGKTDIITDGINVYRVDNGCPQMAKVTGTGCMQGALTAAFSAVTDCTSAALCAAAALGICGERSTSARGSASFRISLIDELSTLAPQTLELSAKISTVDEEEAGVRGSMAYNAMKKSLAKNFETNFIFFGY